MSKRVIVNKERFNGNSEARENFKWVIARYIELGEKDRAISALDDFFDTFFPSEEEVSDDNSDDPGVDFNPFNLAEVCPKFIPAEKEVKIFDQEWITARGIIEKLCSRFEFLSSRNKDRAVRSFAIHIAKNMTASKYRGFVMESCPKMYSSDLETEIVTCFKEWERMVYI